MKRIIIALLAVVATINVSAQELRWGVAGGLNFANERAKTAGVKVSSDSYIGFQVGAKAEMDFSSYLTDGFFLEGSFLRVVVTLVAIQILAICSCLLISVIV